MTIIDVTKDYLELLLSKKDIETKLLENNTIKNEMDIGEFIEYINLTEYIYWYNENIIMPFKIITTEKDVYVYVVNAGENVNLLINALSDINWDFKKLTLKQPEDIVTNNLLNTPRFIINGKLYFNTNNK